MSLGEKIKKLRNSMRLSQERLAEQVGVSRQAVTKWENDVSYPSTENLIRLSEIFNVPLEELVSRNNNYDLPVRAIYEIIKNEEDERQRAKQKRKYENIKNAFIIFLLYAAIYLSGRVIWVDFKESSLLGWLFISSPFGAHSYLFGWLLSSNMFYYSMLVSMGSALFGKREFSFISYIFFVIGFISGVIFGPVSNSSYHLGWAIWGGVFIIGIVTGILQEKIKANRIHLRTKYLLLFAFLCVCVVVIFVLLNAQHMQYRF